MQTLMEDMSKPEVVRDGERMKELQRQIQEEEEAIKRLYEHWEEASELNW